MGDGSDRRIVDGRDGDRNGRRCGRRPVAHDIGEFSGTVEIGIGREDDIASAIENRVSAA